MLSTVFGVMAAALMLVPQVRSFVRKLLAKWNYSFKGNPKGRLTLFARGTDSDGNLYNARVTIAGDPGIYATGRTMVANAMALLNSLNAGHEVKHGLNPPVVALCKSPKYIKIMNQYGVHTFTDGDSSATAKSA